MDNRTHIDLPDEKVTEFIKEVADMLTLDDEESTSYARFAITVIAALHHMSERPEEREPNDPILHIHTIGKWEVHIKEIYGKADLILMYDGKVRLIRTLPDIDKAYHCAMTALAN